MRSRDPVALDEPYSRYVANVSPAAYAISRPLAGFLWRLAVERRPRRMLDLGSGFSSYVFRRYAAEAGAGAGRTEVWSVDDDHTWLSRTRDFLASEGLESRNLLHWSDLGSLTGDFDLVLHDLGTVASRLTTVHAALGRVSRGGALVLDDMDVEPYRRHVERLLDTAGLAWSAASEETLDDRGRYSVVALRDGSEPATRRWRL